MKDKQKPICKYCEDEGLMWVKNGKEGTSTMYRCPFCRHGREHPLKDIPFPAKPICNCANHSRKNY